MTPSLGARPTAVRLPRPSVGRSILRFLRPLPFLGLHLACLAVFFVPTTALAVGLCVAFYFVRMFAITAGYHRYFAHRAYKTSRWFQFVLACLGASCLQKGPLWWSATHRNHHRHSDTPEDPHSPRVWGLWQAHFGWILSPKHLGTDRSVIRDWLKFPELRWLERLHAVPGVLLAVACYLIDGWSGLVWGFVVSTVVLYHGSFLVNSICHIFGRRRYPTTDDSRNNALVAIVTLGEGWHNNHHHYQSSANQGFFWWEFDISYYIIRMMSWVGLVWGIRKPPPKKLVPSGAA